MLLQDQVKLALTFETLMNVTCVEILYPPLLLAFTAIEKFPAPNVCVAFRTVLHHTTVLLSATFLNDQFHAVGALVEVSLNWTVSGEAPEVMLALKLATGADDDPVTVIYPVFRVLLYPPGIVCL